MAKCDETNTVSVVWVGGGVHPSTQQRPCPRAPVYEQCVLLPKKGRGGRAHRHRKGHIGVINPTPTPPANKSDEAYTVSVFTVGLGPMAMSAEFESYIPLLNNAPVPAPSSISDDAFSSPRIGV